MLPTSALLEDDMTNPAYVEFISGSLKGSRFILPENRELRVGRARGAEIQILEDLVSRNHARIQVGASVTVLDLGSRNGTYVNGRRIDRATLESGDRLLFGTSVGQVWIPPREPAPQSRLSASIAGKLSEIPLTDVLQLLASAGKTGVINVSADFHARIDVSRGNITSAAIEELGVQGFKAFVRILRWEHGEFALEPGSGPSVREAEPLLGSTQSALMEAMRQMDELALIEARLGGLDCDLEVSPEAPPPMQALPRAIVKVLRSGPGTLRDCLDGIMVPDLEVAQCVETLLRQGTLRGLDPDDPRLATRTNLEAVGPRDGAK